MISYIRGEVIDRSENSVTIDVGGLGFEVMVPYGTLCALERVTGPAELYTYLQVREDDMTLFGFPNKQDLKTFKLLLTVNGIGPKGALAIMSSMRTEDLILAVLGDDSKTIAKTPGIGAKTAAKLVLELKDKFSLSDTLHADIAVPASAGVKNSAAGTAQLDEDVRSEATEALVALGYSASEALKAVRSVEVTEGMTVDKVLRAALKFM